MQMKRHTCRTNRKSLMLTAKRGFIVSPNAGFRVVFNASTMTLYNDVLSTDCYSNTVMKFVSPKCFKVGSRCKIVKTVLEMSVKQQLVWICASRMYNCWWQNMASGSLSRYYSMLMIMIFHIVYLSSSLSI